MWRQVSSASFPTLLKHFKFGKVDSSFRELGLTDNGWDKKPRRDDDYRYGGGGGRAGGGPSRGGGDGRCGFLAAYLFLDVVCALLWETLAPHQNFAMF